MKDEFEFGIIYVKAALDSLNTNFFPDNVIF